MIGNSSRISSPSLNDYEYLSNENITSLLNNVHYFNNRPTVVYAYGFTQTYDSNATQRVIEAYIERNDHNILLIDWFKYSSGDYIYHAVPSAPKVAEVIAKTLLQMKDSGFNLDKFHLVGFSLGAQLCGMIGRSINTQSNGMFKISRITALDPAQPLFYGFWAFFFRIQPISKDDGNLTEIFDLITMLTSEFLAIFVDVIHSDIATFGAPVATGTVGELRLTGFYLYKFLYIYLQTFGQTVEGINPIALHQFSMSLIKSVSSDFRT